MSETVAINERAESNGGTEPAVYNGETEEHTSKLMLSEKYPFLLLFISNRTFIHVL